MSDHRRQSMLLAVRNIRHSPLTANESGELSWDVSLERAPTATIGMDWLGLELADFRQLCQSRLNVDLGFDVWLVSGIRDSGQIALWNRESPLHKVMVGDRIVTVNGSSLASEMHRLVTETVCYPGCLGISIL